MRSLTIMALLLVLLLPPGSVLGDTSWGVGPSYSFSHDFDQHTKSRTVEFSLLLEEGKYNLTLTHFEPQFRDGREVGVDNWVLTGYRRWYWREFFVGTGGALSREDRVGSMLGSHIQFAQQVGVQLGKKGKVELALQHLSCAGS
jgi:hypothetical protein